ncbi:MAG TPA: glycosyltransferase family 39 protein [Candidatus Dormibacteraeota bacterium]|nr:glycosyltransferase family 39 protein [Candidatus Dormibacteraeota bacterium]
MEPVVIGALLLAGFLVRLPHLGQPILEAYSFRQTQTAYTALLFHEHGINLIAPQLPILGSPWQVPFEFPLFQAVAALFMNAGLAPDVALRFTDLLCFMAAAFALWGLVRHISNRLAAALALIAFLVIPYDVFWSRTSMIDYMAVAFGLGYAWVGMVWFDRRQTRFLVLAVVLGSLGMLVKLPTALFWTVPLLLYTCRGIRPHPRTWLRANGAPVAALMVVPLALTELWTVHADHIKAASPTTNWLTTAGLMQWNFGTLDQRLTLSDWNLIAQRLQDHIISMPIWVFAALCLVAVVRGKAVWAGVVLAGILPIAVFFNLFWVHDYYLIAVTPVVAAVMGYSLDALVKSVRRNPLRIAALAAAGLWVGFTLFTVRGYLTPMYQGEVVDPQAVLPAAAELRATTRPGDLVVFVGLEWSSAVPYYSRRQGMMLPPPLVAPALLDSLPAQGYRYLFSPWGTHDSISPVARQVIAGWEWFGRSSQHVFVLGNAYKDVGTPVAASRDLAAPPAGATALSSAGPRTIPCNGSSASISVPAAMSGWLQFAPTTYDPATVWINPNVPIPSVEVDGNWIPAARTVVVRSLPAGTPHTVTLSCSGTDSLTLEAAYGVTDR